MTGGMARTLTRDEALGIFDGALRAARELETLRVMRAHMAEGVRGYGMGPVVSVGGASSPTERQGEALADRRDELDAEERALIERVETVRELCAGIGRSIGIKYESAILLHYIYGMTYEQVAAALGVAKVTVLRWRDVAVGEVMERGTAYLLELARDGGDFV